MSNVYAQSLGRVAAHAPSDVRMQFVRLTYAHLMGAILAFVGLTTLLVKSPFAPRMLEWLGAGSYNWLLVLGAFMAAGWVAERWAASGGTPGRQYMGLALYVVAEAILFTPILFIAAFYSDPNVLPTAALLTALVFGGLTATVFLTKKDFSFLGGALAVGMMGALGLIVASVLFGFTLGTLFAVAMVVLASGYILYYTSKVLNHYPIGSHVAASLALFAAVALLFFYILRLVMSRD